MTPTTWIVVLWIAFIGSHLGLASLRVEPVLKRKLGEGGFMGFYSLIALAAFVPLCWIYIDNRHAGEWLWHVPVGPGLRMALYVGMGVSLLLLVAGALRPAPSSMTAGPEAAVVRGATRITRSPLVLGAGLLMALHLIPNGSTADVAFFGGFTIFTLLGAWHQDVRKLAADAPGFREFHADTSFIPFARGGFRGFAEIGALVWLVTALAFLGIRALHPMPFWPH